MTTMKTAPPLIPPREDAFFRKLESGADGRDNGKITNLVRVLAQSPVTLKACLDFNKTLEHGLLTPKKREQIALLMAEVNRCRYSLSMHCDRSREMGLTEEEIESARKARAADPSTAVLLRFVLHFVLERGAVGAQAFESLRTAGFSDAHIVEIIANMAQNIFENYFNIGIATPIDFPLVTPGVIASSPVASGGSTSPAPRHRQQRRSRSISGRF